MTDSRWHAPREDGATLVVPAWRQLPDLVAENHRSIQQSSLRWQDRSLADIRQLAWEGANQQLSKWCHELGWPSKPLQRPLIVTGHQPELFHPGVWAKNVAISKLAKELNGSSFNINVDSDVAKSITLKVPVTSADGYDQTFNFSHAHSPLPYEEWESDDEAMFAQLPSLVEPVIKTWPWQPILPSFWQAAVDAHQKTKNLPQRWIIARRAWEHQHSITNHELTMSRWCDTSFFRWLLHVFISDAQWFAKVYNDELHRYRKEYRIRSVHHPVADLLVTNDLVELPFWAWPNGSIQRGRLCIRKHYGTIDLICILAGKETLISTLDSTLKSHDLPEDWKFRPKALITSMMFRLFLSDLFVHGIGGAVYDELTDRIFQRYWKIKLPRFAIITATLRLPWDRQAVTEEQPRRLRQSLRSMHWNPDRFLTEPIESKAIDLKKLKQSLITTQAEVETLKDRHQQYESIRTQLAPYVAKEQHRVDALLVQTLQQLKRDEHQFSREHPWVLYPEATLLSLNDAFAASSGS